MYLFFRLFLKFVKIEISIRLFHLVCQFGKFTPVLIRVFAPYPLQGMIMWVKVVQLKEVKYSGMPLDKCYKDSISCGL